MITIPPQQMDFPSLGWPKDRTILMVGEVAQKLRITDQHVIDLIVEGKLAAVDIAGRQNYVRVPMDAIDDLARALGISRDTLLARIHAHKPQIGTGRAFWRIPVVEGFVAFIRENNSLVVAGK